jgi:hypothetical protein
MRLGQGFHVHINFAPGGCISAIKSLTNILPRKVHCHFSTYLWMLSEQASSNCRTDIIDGYELKHCRTAAGMKGGHDVHTLDWRGRLENES